MPVTLTGLFIKEGSSYKTVKKTIDCSKKGPIKLLSCHFVVLTKNQDRLSVRSKKQGIYIGNLDATVLSLLRTQSRRCFLIRLPKYCA